MLSLRQCQQDLCSQMDGPCTSGMLCVVRLIRRRMNHMSLTTTTQIKRSMTLYSIGQHGLSFNRQHVVHVSWIHVLVTECMYDALSHWHTYTYVYMYICTQSRFVAGLHETPKILTNNRLQKGHRMPSEPAVCACLLFLCCTYAYANAYAN